MNSDTFSTPSEIWYVASPYAHDDEIVVEKRAFKACEITAELINNNKDTVVFSPIAYTHHLYKKYDADPEMGWYVFDLEFMHAFFDYKGKENFKLVILMIEGWNESDGVNLETAYAVNMDIPILYYCPIKRDFVDAPNQEDNLMQLMLERIKIGGYELDGRSD